MLGNIKNIYYSPYLTGECLVRPLKAYNTYFDHQANQYTDWKKTAVRIAQFILGIVVYPILGLFALIGMIFKAFEYPEVKKNNEKIKNGPLPMCILGINNSGGFAGSQFSGEFKSGKKLQSFISWKLTKQNSNQQSEAIKREIDECTARGRKVFFSRRGIIDGNDGVIIAQLSELVSSSS